MDTNAGQTENTGNTQNTQETDNWQFPSPSEFVLWVSKLPNNHVVGFSSTSSYCPLSMFLGTRDGLYNACVTSDIYWVYDKAGGTGRSGELPLWYRLFVKELDSYTNNKVRPIDKYLALYIIDRISLAYENQKKGKAEV